MRGRKLTVVFAVAATFVCAVVAALAAGVPGALSAIVGGLIVIAFFGSTPAVLGPVAKTSPGLSLLFAMLFFFTKVLALVALFVVLSRAVEGGSQLEPKAISLTVIVVTFVWIGARIFDATQDRTPTYDLPSGSKADPDRF
ncbi:MAG TPA: hypothetical protein PLQ19_01685 [Aeromicrobium sp.]|nr:hypothetical protein [Aeromicrobium sp.]